MLYEIDILDDAMILFDADGNSYECHSLTTYRDAKRTVQAWASRYAVLVAEAYQRLATHFSKR